MHNLSFAVIDFARPKFPSRLEGKSYPPQIPSHQPFLAPSDQYGQLAFFFFFTGAPFPTSPRPREGGHLEPQLSLPVGEVWGKASGAESPTVSKL